MTRNKELYLPIALSMALTLVSGLLCGFLGGPWAALTGSGSVLLTTLLWMSTTWSRYKKLQELGEYLASVYAGGELLDIRDNREGELSLGCCCCWVWIAFVLSFFGFLTFRHFRP